MVSLTNIKLKSGLIILSFIVIDQITKYLAFVNLKDHAFKVIPDFMNFILVFNKGVSFSMFHNLPQNWAPYLLFTFATLAALVFFYWINEKETAANRWALIFLTSGALGNAIDRLTHKAVVDFIDVFYKNQHFPTFNVADIFITFGVVFLILDIIIVNKNKIK